MCPRRIPSRSRRQAWCALASASDRYRTLEGAPRGSEAGSTERFGSLAKESCTRFNCRQKTASRDLAHAFARGFRGIEARAEIFCQPRGNFKASEKKRDKTWPARSKCRSCESCSHQKSGIGASQYDAVAPPLAFLHAPARLSFSLRKFFFILPAKLLQLVDFSTGDCI